MSLTGEGRSRGAIAVGCGPPTVSVIVPTYNRAGFLPRALDSVLAQTYRDFELIVVDDHSNDNTGRVVAEFTRDDRVRVFRHDRNLGASAALNSGINVARGEFVAFLDDDDVWLPEKLGAQMELFQGVGHNVGLVYGWRHHMVSESDQPVRTIRQTSRGDIYEQMLALETPVPPSSWLVRTSVARALGGFDEEAFVNDVDFVVRLCEQGWCVDYVPQVVLLKYQHTFGQMVDETPENLALRASFIRQHLAKFATELSERPSSRARVYLRLARYEIRYRRVRGLLDVANAFLADCSSFGVKLGFYARRLYYLLRYATRSTSLGGPQSQRLSERMHQLLY